MERLWTAICTRTLDAFKAFVKTLGPPCGPLHLSKCTEEQKAALEGYLATPVEELSTKLATLETELDTAKTNHDTLLKSLQSQYEESNKAVEAMKAQHAPAIKMMKVALANLTAPTEEAAAEKPKEEL